MKTLPAVPVRTRQTKSAHALSWIGALGAVLALAAGAAYGQTATYSFVQGRVTLYRLDGPNKTATALLPDPALDYQRFSKNQCECKQPYRLVIPALNPSPIAASGEVEVWAGTKCNDLSTTDRPRQERCKLLNLFSNIKDFVSEQSFEMTADQFLILNDPNTSELKSCQPREGAITLWILVDQGNDDMYELVDQSIVIRYDGLPPDAPRDVKISSGDRKLSVSWTLDANQIINGGIQLYCVKRTDELAKPTQPPDFAVSCTNPPMGLLDPKYLCTRGALGASATVDGLENDVPYKFAVVAFDRALNPSEVTEMSFVPGVPIPTIDGYELYRNAGGRATGGFCAAHPGAQTPHLAGLLLSVGLGLAMVAGRRRSRHEPHVPDAAPAQRGGDHV